MRISNEEYEEVKKQACADRSADGKAKNPTVWIDSKVEICFNTWKERTANGIIERKPIIMRPIIKRTPLSIPKEEEPQNWGLGLIETPNIKIIKRRR